MMKPKLKGLNDFPSHTGGVILTSFKNWNRLPVTVYKNKISPVLFRQHASPSLLLGQWSSRNSKPLRDGKPESEWGTFPWRSVIPKKRGQNKPHLISHFHSIWLVLRIRSYLLEFWENVLKWQRLLEFWDWLTNFLVKSSKVNYKHVL